MRLNTHPEAKALTDFLTDRGCLAQVTDRGAAAIRKGLTVCGGQVVEISE